MHPPRKALGALLVLVLVVAGCATVPTSGPVERHSPQPAAASAGVQVAPLPPAQDASQLLVVEGFLHAMSVYEDGYPIARQYLTQDAARSWRPEAGVQVYADGYSPVETDQSVVLTATLFGQIDPSGVFTSGAGNLRVVFDLQKNADGQWRIAHPPDGLLVSRYLFSTGFDAVDLHFLAASGDVLVPELRYFPVGQAGLERAAAAVVTGASPWLSPVVRKPMPSGLSVDSVVLDDDGTARVTLGGAVGQVSAEQQEALLAELTWTLSGFPQVSAVQVFAGLQRWVDRTGADTLTKVSLAQYNPAGTAFRPAFVARQGRLLRQRELDDWNALMEVASALPKVKSLAISARQDAWAATTEDGTQLVAGGLDAQRAKTIRTGTGLLPPQYSRTGELWSLAASGLTGLRVYRDGLETKLVQRGLPKGRVVAGVLSPDGYRLALIIASGGSAQLGLARIVRTDAKLTVDGWRPIDLSPLGVTGAQPLGVGWNTATEFALLRNDGKGGTSVALVGQDGASLTDIGPSDSTSLRSVTSAAGRPVLALGTGNALYRFTGGFDWRAVTTQVEAVGYPG